MNGYENLEPKRVFQIFEEICEIPHGSRNTKAISDYCIRFAKERGLACHQDEKNNVIIWKNASIGYEFEPPIIIQGHMDMVCEKEAGVEKDFEKEGLDLYVDGDFLKARGTTLGGDDAIAIAFAFAVLDSHELAHPPLEVVITTDEEIGMLGAEAMDLSMLKGKRLLNIDSDEEGVFLTGCAGGLSIECELPIIRTKKEGTRFLLKVSGLKGGHSGAEIHKERANAIILMGRALKLLSEEGNISLETLEGGLKDNAIPREAYCGFIADANLYERLQHIVEQLNTILKKEYQNPDKNILLSLQKAEAGAFSVLEQDSFTKILVLLRNIPYGVQNMSMDIPGLVETSLNPGIMELNETNLRLCFSIRSSVTSRKYDVTDKLQFLIEFLGGSVNVTGDYPAWEYNPDSRLRELFRETYADLFGTEPTFQTFHAGLECGIFSDKIEGLDCISFGPNNFDIHTPKERLSISSTQRVWKLFIEILRKAKAS